MLSNVEFEGHFLFKFEELYNLKYHIMKKLAFNVMLLLTVGLVISSCSNKDTEARIARLEGRVAELEAGNGSSRPVTATPSNSNVASIAEEVGTGPFPAFEFTEEDHDFGTIKEGDVVNHVFKFTNSGDVPLIISSATASCGCTVPQWPREPVAVGGTGEIHVSFNSKNKPGIQNKTITITANTNPKTTRLKIKANVAPGTAADGPVK